MSTHFWTTQPCLQVNLTWGRDPIENQYVCSGPLKKSTWPRWALNLICDMIAWYRSADTLFWQVLIDNNMDVQFLKKARYKPKLNVSVNLLAWVWPPSSTTPSTSSCRAYAPTSNTASHDNNKKINSWVSFAFLYRYGASLGSPFGPTQCEI